MSINILNKQQIVNKHMNTLLHLEVVSFHNLKGLWHLFEKVETLVKGLKSLGIPPSSYGSLLSSILMSKLPQDLWLVVSWRVTDSDCDLYLLMKVIDEEIDAWERELWLCWLHPIDKLEIFLLLSCCTDDRWHRPRMCILSSKSLLKLL